MCIEKWRPQRGLVVCSIYMDPLQWGHFFQWSSEWKDDDHKIFKQRKVPLLKSSPHCSNGTIQKLEGNVCSWVVWSNIWNLEVAHRNMSCPSLWVVVWLSSHPTSIYWSTCELAFPLEQRRHTVFGKCDMYHQLSHVLSENLKIKWTELRTCLFIDGKSNIPK